MTKPLKKLIISIVILLIFAALIFIVLTKNIDLGIFKIISFENLKMQKSNLESADNTYASTVNNYNSLVASVNSYISLFDTEKAKYDSISDETIQIIENSKTEEKYSIEYIWIRLDNYAKKNNLSIILVEPGGQQASASTDAGSNTSTSNAQNAATTVGNTSNSEALNVQVIGNYLNVSDFIFDLETDEELMFKIDNITMQYTADNNIKTTFAIKNISVIK